MSLAFGSMFCGLGEGRRAGPREAALAFGKEVLLDGRGFFSSPAPGGIGWTGAGHVETGGPPRYKIFKIKLVTTYLGYKPSWYEGLGHSCWVVGGNMDL